MTQQQRNLVRRTVAQSASAMQGMEKSRVCVIDLSPSKISKEEAAKITFDSNDIHYRYNRKRGLLLLQFDDARQKLHFMKRLPSWLWHRRCVLSDYTTAQLNLWHRESLH